LNSVKLANTNYRLYDTHCHLDFADVDDDRPAVIARARAQSVAGIAIPGTRRLQFAKLQSVAAQWPELISVGIGLHPYFIKEHHPDDLVWMNSELQRNAALWVGEIGLDRTIEEWSFQQDLFDSQLQLAQRWQRPVVLHHRQSLDLMLPAIRRILGARQDTPTGINGVVHAFSGSLQQAMAYIELGFKLGVGGVISYSRAQKTRATIAKVPLGSLVLETDAPAMPLAGLQGQRNEPAQIAAILDVLLTLRQEPADEVVKQLSQTSQQVFQWPLGGANEFD